MKLSEIIHIAICRDNDHAVEYTKLHEDIALGRLISPDDLESLMFAFEANTHLPDELEAPTSIEDILNPYHAQTDLAGKMRRDEDLSEQEMAAIFCILRRRTQEWVRIIAEEISAD